MIIVNGFQPLTIITKSSTLDVAAVLDPPLSGCKWFNTLKFNQSLLKFVSIFGILFDSTNLHFLSKKVRYYNNTGREHRWFSFTNLRHIQHFTVQSIDNNVRYIRYTVRDLKVDLVH